MEADAWLESLPSRTLPQGSDNQYCVQVSFLIESQAINFKEFRGSKNDVTEEIRKATTSAENGKIFVLGSNGFFSIDLSQQSFSDSDIMKSNGPNPTFMVIYSEKMGDLKLKKPVLAKSWKMEPALIQEALQKASRLAYTARACYTHTFLSEEHHDIADDLNIFTNKLQTIEKLCEPLSSTTKEEFESKIQEIVKKAESQLITFSSGVKEPVTKFLQFPNTESLTKHLQSLHSYLKLRRVLTDLGWEFDSIDYEDRIRSIEEGITMIKRYRTELPSGQLSEKYVQRCQGFLSEWSASTVRSMSRCPRRALLLEKNALVYKAFVSQDLIEQVHLTYDVASILSMCLNADKTSNAWEKTCLSAPAAIHSLTAPTNRLRHAMPPDLLKMFRTFLVESFEKEFFSHLGPASLASSAHSDPPNSSTREWETGSFDSKSPPRPAVSMKEAIQNLLSQSLSSQNSITTSDLQHLYELAEQDACEKAHLEASLQTFRDYDYQALAHRTDEATMKVEIERLSLTKNVLTN